MKALMYTAPWEMSLQEVPNPVPKEDEVLIDVRAVGICGSDVHGFMGITGRREPPMVMGHEFSGVVAKVGPGVTDVEEEDEVIVSPMFPYDGFSTRYVVGVNRPGAYADQVIVHKSMLTPKVPDLSWHHAAMCEPLSIAMHAVGISPIGLMESVAIVGAGTIGLLVLVAAKLKGAGTVIITDMSEHRLEIARQLGADVTVNVKETDPVKAARDATDGLGVHVAFEAVGVTAAVQQAGAMTRNMGHVTWIGNSAKMVEVDMQEVVTRELTVLGSYGFKTEFASAIQAISTGRVDVGPLIERVAPLAEGPEIITGLAKHELDLVKVILEP